MSHHHWARLPDPTPAADPRVVRGWRGRLLCLIGAHQWHVGRYVTYCLRCYASAD